MAPTFTNIHHAKQGYITISAMILILVMSAGIVITTASLAIGQGQAGLATTKGEQILQLVEGCAEDILMKIKKDPNYLGSKTIIQPEGTCLATIELEGSNWNITVTNSIPSEHVKSFHISFSRTDTISITSWQEL